MEINTDGPAAEPKDASTVVVLRPNGGPGDEDLVFMLRRSSKSKFMPDALVFPGGKVDPADGPAGDDAAFEAAARREVFEEASIELTHHALHWFDTWLTPSLEKRRFTARFYLCRIEAHEGHDAKSDEFETHEGRWASPSEFIAENLEGKVDLPPPTLSVLMRLMDYKFEDLVGRPADELSIPILPKFFMDESKPCIVLPHDPDYSDLPGEGSTPAERTSQMPTRFVRIDNRWQPGDRS